MKTAYKILSLTMMLALLMLPLASCSNDNSSDLALDGQTEIQSLVIDGHNASIDHKAGTVTVRVPMDADVTSMKVESMTLSPGASASIAVGQRLDGNMPHSITVTNGNVFSRYTLFVKKDNATILTATLNGKYNGTIDNDARTISFFIPMSENLSAMTFSCTLPAGTTAQPASGSTIDCTSPVTVTVTCNTAVIPYTLTVVQTDISQEPKAFLGTATDINSLGDEARAAAQWMLANIPNCSYVSIIDVVAGNVHLSDYKMVWAHLDFTDWPGIMWDSRDLINDYYIHGGNILASRDGARYINDVWRIAKDQQSPNNMFGGEANETLDKDLTMAIIHNPTHPLFEGLTSEDGVNIPLVGARCSNSGRTLQWFVDWGGYGSMQLWKNATGAKALASNADGDPNCVTIAEFEPREVLSGVQAGRVFTIGTPGFEFNVANGVANPYRNNIETLAGNAVKLLCR